LKVTAGFKFNVEIQALAQWQVQVLAQQQVPQLEAAEAEALKMSLGPLVVRC
jgi:hypothetical protein